MKSSLTLIQQQVGSLSFIQDYDSFNLVHDLDIYINNLGTQPLSGSLNW